MGVRELINEVGEEQAVYKPAMIISLCRYWQVSGSTDTSQLPTEQLAELARSVTDDVNVSQPLSTDLINNYTEEEEDLFFEVAVGDRAQ